MSTRVVERVDDWDQRSFGDGYRGLQDLAAEGFSGVVRAGGAELYMTSGTVVGIPTGSMDAVEGASGTAYEAPDDALPLLAVMQAGAGDPRAQYYSEETSISEVDATLEDGGFTGFVELSENVLSGDYYLVYHGGQSSSVAFVGNSSRLQTDAEAYDLLADEVGIYKVYQVDVDPIEIPDASGAASGAPAAGTATTDEEAGSDESEPDDDAVAETDPAADPDPATADDGADSDGSDGPTGGPVDAGSTSDAGSPAGPGSPDAGSPGPGPGAGSSDPDTADTEGTADASGATGASTTASAAAETEDPSPESGGRTGGDEAETEPAEASSSETGGSASVDTSADVTGAGESSEEVTAPDTATEADDTGRNAHDREQVERESADAGRTDRSEATDGSETAAASTGTRDQPGTEPAGSGGRADSSAGTESVSDAGRTEGAGAETGGRDRTGTRDQSSPPTPEPTTGNERAAGTGRSETGRPSPESTAASGGSAAAASDAGQLETRSIPSLDPEQSATPQRSNGARGDTPGRATSAGTETASPAAEATSEPASRDRGATGEPAGGAREPPTEPEATDSTPSESADAGQAADDGQVADPERVEELEADVAAAESEIERLEAELETASGERDEFEAELESARQELADVRTERDELREEVERLEEEIDRLEAEYDLAVDAERRLSPGEALQGTDLFVRYGSKGEATLEKAHDSSVRHEDVNANLRLEKHAQFDTENVAVGGKDYHEFLESTVEYKFIEWAVRDLLFEIRNTGHGGVLKDLYNALPQVDRAEIKGVVTVTLVEDGQETRTDETFDVVLRDRMGNPLLVANLNDSRQAATKSMMESLITSAERVGQSDDALAAAFIVTTSFFEPEALETASDATQGGILSRDKRKSYVNLSRKRGYHLCLVEARNENFHLAVPEL